MDNRSPNTPDAFARLQAAERATGIPRNAAEAEAGTYPRGRLDLHGMGITLENARGSIRSKTTKGGKHWANRQAAAYGFFDGTLGNDGDEVDCFIGPWPETRRVWVINQGWSTGFDEHKVMLGFMSEADARAAYLGSYDRDWTGLQSLCACSVSQLKWWLKHGDMSKPLTLDQLPFDGSTDMEKTLWTPEATPVGKAMHTLMYELRLADAGQDLLLDSVVMADFLADPEFRGDALPLLDGLVVEVNRLSQKMTRLQSVLEMASDTVKPVRFTISDPVRARGVTMLAVLFELSDGQAVTIWFHNPDTTPNKLMPLDELISWKFVLNKKDVSIWVAPERGRDLNIREVGRRIMRLAEKNSAKFLQANANAAAVLENEKAIDADIVALGARLDLLNGQLELARERRADADKDAARAAAIAQEQADRDAAITAANEAERARQLADPTSPLGYAAIKGDEAALLANQDTLDAFFQARIIEVRNGLREKGWDGAAYKALSKRGVALDLDLTQVGAGRNVVGVSYRLLSAGGKEEGSVEDNLTGPAEDVVFSIDTLLLAIPEEKWSDKFYSKKIDDRFRVAGMNTANPISPSYPTQAESDAAAEAYFGGADFPVPSDAGAPAATEVVDALPEGWTEASPGGMATNRDPLRGGIVDSNDEGWFVIMNNDGLSNAGQFATRAAAFAYVEHEIAKVTPAAADAGADAKLTEAEALKLLKWADMGTRNGVKTHKLFFRDPADGRKMSYGSIVKSKDDSKWTVDAPDGDDAHIADVKEAKALGLRFAIARLQRDGYVEGEAATEAGDAEVSATAAVDAAYQFASATDDFKEWVAASLGDTEYSPFLTAKAMDEAAKTSGLSIAWDVTAEPLLDAATEPEDADKSKDEKPPAEKADPKEGDAAAAAKKDAAEPPKEGDKPDPKADVAAPADADPVKESDEAEPEKGDAPPAKSDGDEDDEPDAEKEWEATPEDDEDEDGGAAPEGQERAVMDSTEPLAPAAA